MSKLFIFLISIVFVSSLVLPIGSARAAGSCFCATISKDALGQLDPKTTDPKTFDDTSKYDVSCYDVDPLACAAGGSSKQIDKKYTSCNQLATPDTCQKAVTDWHQAKDAAVQSALTGTRAQRTELHNKGVIEKLLPPCVFDATVSGDCKHINIFIEVGIDIADYILSIVGALALAVFIYGGVLMIISEGHSERVEKGKGAMVAALIGLIVIFGAYILVKFFAGVVGVQSGFNLQ
jgi:hypothetical protein